MAGKASRKKEPSRLRYISSNKRASNAEKRTQRHARRLIDQKESVLNMTVPRGTRRANRRAAWLAANPTSTEQNPRMAFATWEGKADLRDVQTA
jgi:hypothetical protein